MKFSARSLRPPRLREDATIGLGPERDRIHHHVTESSLVAVGVLITDVVV